VIRTKSAPKQVGSQHKLKSPNGQSGLEAALFQPALQAPRRM